MTGTTIAKAVGWRTPAVIVICGCLAAVCSFGPRSALGFFLTPMSAENGWGRDVFALAIAIQSLVYGIGAAIAGAVADRFGTARVLIFGAVLYALGLSLMAQSTSPGALYLSAGVLIGLGLSGSSFTLVIAAFGKLLPASWRSLAFGVGTAAGSFGQFLYSPLGVSLIDGVGWQQALIVFGGLVLFIIPLAFVISTPAMDSGAKSGAAVPQSLRQALGEALGHRSYVLLVIGYFTCGFQLAFVTVHLPSYLADKGLPAYVGGWTIAVIGLFNIIGALGSGWLGSRMPMRYILSIIYFTRALAIAVFVSLPITPASTLIFGAVTGLLWLSTVPPTSGLIALMFGARWLAMLTGFAFFSHQVGGFMGAWLGGFLFERTGSYDFSWWLAVLFGVLSALINLPIVEQPAARAAAQPA